MKNPKRPKDTNIRAKFIVDLATGETNDPDPNEGKNPAAVELGCLGGLKGGRARASKLTIIQPQPDIYSPPIINIIPT